MQSTCLQFYMAIVWGLLRNDFWKYQATAIAEQQNMFLLYYQE